MPKLEQGIEYIITAEDFTEAAMKAIAERIDSIKARSIAISVKDETEAATKAVAERIDNIKPKSIVIDVDDRTSKAIEKITEKIAGFQAVRSDGVMELGVNSPTPSLARSPTPSLNHSPTEKKEVNEYRTLTEEQIKAVKGVRSDGVRSDGVNSLTPSLTHSPTIDWRTAKDLSVDQEAVRRVALAKEEETAAQKALAETARSTAQAAASLAEIEKVITQEG